MVEYLSGNRIQGSSTLTTTPPITSWKELDRVTLTSSGDTLDTGIFTAKDNIMILENKIPTGSCRSKYQFNGDDNDNYSQRYTDNGGSDGTFTADPVIYAYHSGGSAKSFSVHSIINNSSREKLLIGNIVENGGDGNNSPNRQELVGKWANTSAQINRVKLFNDGSGSFDTGSELIILGCDNDEANDGSQFWEHLKTVDLTSSGDDMDTGTITAKKYLLLEWYCVTTGGEAYVSYSFNNDSTTSNYASRRSNNFASDDNYPNSHDWGAYLGYGGGTTDKWGFDYIVNNSSTEKLGLGWINITGASNAIGDTNEHVFKWKTTGSQITRINGHNGGSGSLNTGSYLKVWGAN